jgi:hypothetical protein
MVGSPKVRVGAANDPVACRRGVGDRYRNSWRSRTDCGLARASFRLVESERRPAEILKDEAIAANIAKSWCAKTLQSAANRSCTSR